MYKKKHFASNYMKQASRNLPRPTKKRPKNTHAQLLPVHTHLLFLIATILILPVSSALAQRDTASLVGTVRDATGAVVPGASITVTNRATNISVTVTADNSGDYVVTPLQ